MKSSRSLWTSLPKVNSFPGKLCYVHKRFASNVFSFFLPLHKTLFLVLGFRFDGLMQRSEGIKRKKAEGKRIQLMVL